MTNPSPIEFWQRKNDDIIPQDRVVKVSPRLFNNLINGYRNDLMIETNDKAKAIIKETIKQLEDEREKQCISITIRFTPLLNYELNNISQSRINGQRIGCDGLPVNDLEADINAKHCLEPRQSYKEWESTKTDLIKSAIAIEIMNNSMPVIPEELKKKVRELMIKTSEELALIRPSMSSDINILDRIA